jgi:hypothetical protein
MNKVNTLFKKYYRILNEQEPGTPEATAPVPPEAPTPAAPEAAPEAPMEPAIKPLPENEKYIIKILTNAFIFNPSLFDSNKKKFIDNKIEIVRKSINVPVSKMVEDIKSILNLDNSLRVESVTLKLLRKYTNLLEQTADATEPQTDTTNISTVNTADPQGNMNKLNLAEIFPLYKELIVQALAHIPTDEELIILKPIVNEFGDTDPEKIVKTIKDLLNQESDRDIEGDLSVA